MDDHKAFHFRFFVTAVLLAAGMLPAGSRSRVLATLRDDGPCQADLERMERGYYESLLDRNSREPSPTTAVLATRKAAHDANAFDAGPLTTAVPDVREFVLKPNIQTNVHGCLWTTNSLGMRDREYSRTKPSGTIRIAFIGDSIGSGWGVSDEAGFEPTLERALDGRSRARSGQRIEILNFAVPGHAPGQRWEDFTRAGGWAMAPDIVLYEATPADPGWDERRLRSLLARRIGQDAPVYRNVVRRVGVEPGKGPEHYRRRLRPYRTEILKEVYRTIAAESREHGATSIWVLVPRVGKSIDSSEKLQILNLAREAGFSVVLDLSGAYEGLKAEAIAISPADFHPNAVGHRRLARRLEAALTRHPAVTRHWSADLAFGEAN